MLVSARAEPKPVTPVVGALVSVELNHPRKHVTAWITIAMDKSMRDFQVKQVSKCVAMELITIVTEKLINAIPVAAERT
jgi:hypothetical protein